MADWVAPAKQTFVDTNGIPIVGGLVWHYEPGTDTLKDTYEDEGALALNTNPVVLDGRGQAAIWGGGLYRQRLTDAEGNPIWDRVTGVGAGSSGSFANVAAVQAADIAMTVGAIYVEGYSVPGIGGAHYLRAPVQTGGVGKIQSHDGAWWEISETEVTPDMFGDIEPGDDHSAILTSFLAFNAPKHRFTKGPTGGYRASNVPTVAGRSYDIEADSSATFVQIANAPVFNFVNGFTWTQAVSGIASANVVLAAGQPATLVNVLTLTANQAVKRGQVLRVISDDDVPWDRPPSGASAYRMGENAAVGIDSGGVTVTLAMPLKFDGSYTTNIRAALYRENRFVWHGNPVFTCDPGGLGAWTQPFVVLSGYLRPYWEGGTFSDGVGVGLQVQGCHAGRFVDLHGQRLRNEPALNQFGYTCADVSGTLNSFVNLSGADVRHALDKGAMQIAANSAAQFYGSTVDTLEDGLVAIGASQDPSGGHSGQFGCITTNARIIGTYQGQSSSYGGFHVYGYHAKVMQSLVEQTRNGFLINCVADAEIASNYMNITGRIYNMGVSGELAGRQDTQSGVRIHDNLAYVFLPTGVAQQLIFMNSLVGNKQRNLKFERERYSFSNGAASNHALFVFFGAVCEAECDEITIDLTNYVGASFAIYVMDGSGAHTLKGRKIVIKQGAGVATVIVVNNTSGGALATNVTLDIEYHHDTTDAHLSLTGGPGMTNPDGGPLDIAVVKYIGAAKPVADGTRWEAVNRARGSLGYVQSPPGAVVPIPGFTILANTRTLHDTYTFPAWIDAGFFRDVEFQFEADPFGVYVYGFIDGPNNRVEYFFGNPTTHDQTFGDSNLVVRLIPEPNQ